MASKQFRNRFKDKVSVLTRHGNFSNETSEHGQSPLSLASNHQTMKAPKAIPSKPTTASLGQFLQLPGVTHHKHNLSQGMSSHLNSSQPILPKDKFLSPLLPEIHEKAPLRRQKQVLGQLGHRNNSTLSVAYVPKEGESGVEAVSRSFEFQPYTMEDYKALRKKTTGKLGGLGPSTIGTEPWMAAWKSRVRRIAYGQTIVTVKNAV